MAHDIDIGKIGKEEMNLRIFQLLYDGIGNSGSIHFRFLVQIRYIFGGGNDDSFLARKRLAHFPVQKIAHMDGFFRLGYLCLP